MKKIIPVRWYHADMKTGSRLNRAFFIHITPKWGIFLYIYDNTHVQTHKNKLLTFDLA